MDRRSILKTALLGAGAVSGAAAAPQAQASAIHVDPKAEVGCFASTNSGMQEYRPRDLTAYACAVLRAAVAPEPGLAWRPSRRRSRRPRRPPRQSL